MRRSSPFHENNGPLRVSDIRFRHPLSLAFVKAAQQSGIPYNDGIQDGIGFYHTTTFEDERGSTSATYLEEVKHIPNLEIRT